jgi:membrane protein YdbS with pleckstrin-like domain
VTPADMWIALVLSVAAVLIAIGALFIAHTWKVLVEDLAVRLDRIERELGILPKLPDAS